MKYAEFIIDLKSSLERKFIGSVTELKIKSIVKINDQVRDAMILMRDNNCISPTFYIDELYEYYLSGASVEQISEMIRKSVISEKTSIGKEARSFEDIDLYDYEKVKDNIIIRVLNQNMNTKYLQDAAYVEFLDLAVCFYYIRIVGRQKHIYGVRIDKNVFEQWGIDDKSLFETAKQNMQRLLGVYLKEVREVFKESIDWDNMDEEKKENIMGALNDPERSPMYILSNMAHRFGAANIFIPGVLSALSEMLDDDLYIIPSSVHEVMVIPVNARVSRDEADMMIPDVNSNVLERGDILSDHVYIYIRENDTIIM